MKNRESFLFSMILLLVNIAGAAGALLTCLGIDFGTVLQPVLFQCGMLFLCLLSGGMWSMQNRKWVVRQWALLIVTFSVCILLFWGKLANGLAWALQGMSKQINKRYGIHLILNLAGEADLMEQSAESVMMQATWGILAVMLPLVLLLGYAVVRKRAIALLPAHAVWFMAACAMDDFPAYVWLVLCILGFAAVVIRGAFRDDERAGRQAVLIGAAVLGAVMALVYRCAIPFMDSRYDAVQEARIELNRKINEEWIPEIKSALARFGSGSGTDVTGRLTRKTGTAYTSDEIYRVTFSSAPKSTVYLRGFAGKDYAGDQWKAAGDSDLEKYYRGKGWELPESGGDLVNLTYNAFRYRSSGKVWVEELANPGSYTVYPYGARLTEDYKVHWDGTAEWERGSWEFLYSPPEDYNPERKAAGTAARDEDRYRDYVYDTFCEYPTEKFPVLTDFLENAGFRTDSVYGSLADVLRYLTGNAVYDLDVPNTPKGQDFVEYFLFESREGYCAHFASSAVLILRYLGIPARYVTGYAAAPGDFRRNPDGTYSAVILDKQAHAWAEVYLDGIGWVPVEMTPGAAPFPRDNTAEQLALAGQLTGEEIGEEFVQTGGNASAGGGNSAGQQESVGKDNSEGDDSAPADEPDQEEWNQEESAGSNGSGEKEQDLASSDSFGIPGQTGQGADSQNPGTGEIQQGSAGTAGQQGVAPGDGAGEPGEIAGEDNDQESTGIRKFLAGAMKALGRVLQTAGLLFLFFIVWKLTWTLIRRSSRGRLERAASREKVFLLHRNIRGLLAVSGCAERLNCPDEDAAEFNILLEKCAFGKKEPGAEELRTAGEFCEKLAREVYAGLPLYRKPLFLGLDVYSFAGKKDEGEKRRRRKKMKAKKDEGEKRRRRKK